VSDFVVTERVVCYPLAQTALLCYRFLSRFPVAGAVL